jgi:hypothetical protein
MNLSHVSMIGKSRFAVGTMKRGTKVEYIYVQLRDGERPVDAISNTTRHVVFESSWDCIEAVHKKGAELNNNETTQ